MSFATAQSINLDKAMSDISGESLIIVTKTVESSAYLKKDISLYPSISRSSINQSITLLMCQLDLAYIYVKKTYRTSKISKICLKDMGH